MDDWSLELVAEDMEENVGTPVELCLISKIIEDGDYRTPRKFGITTAAFKMNEAREMFRTIHDYFHNKKFYGRVPTSRYMTKHHPTYEDLHQKETLPELCEELRMAAMSRELFDGLSEALASIETKQPDEVLEISRELVNKMGKFAPQTKSRVLHETAEEFLEWYEGKKNAEISYGIPWPWEQLTKATQGIDKDDLIIFFGRPKSMKSFITGEVLSTNFYRHSLRSLIYSCEMRPEKFERRLFGSMARVDYNLMKQGKLDVDSDRRLVKVVRGIRTGELRRGNSSLKIVPMTDCPKGMNPLTHLMIEVETYGPDLVLVDSFYRMSKTREWGKQADLVQAMKDATLDLSVPFIATTQGTRLKNRKGEESKDEEHLEDIAYTDAIGQEADLIIRARKQGRYQDKSRLIKLALAGSRESEEEGGALYLRVHPCTRFEAIHWEESATTLNEDEIPSITTPEEVSISPNRRNGKGKNHKEVKEMQKVCASSRWVAPEVDYDVLSGIKR